MPQTKYFLDIAVGLIYCNPNHVSTNAEDTVSGEAVIRAPLGDSEIVITTTGRVAGAIHSLKWNGKEFIDSFDHGRQLQSAANFDGGTKFSGETFNPTEAGSRRDGSGAASSSRLLHLLATTRSLQTTTQMAFWLAPGDKSQGNLAKNESLLSNHLLTKRVTIGYKNLPNVIVYDVTFGVPIGERHRYAQFEAVTGYMPAEFSRFWKYNRATKRLEELTDGPGEQACPVVLATESGGHAMGVFSPQQPSKGYEHAGYGRFRFPVEKVTKWNCVFRIRGEKIEPGDYSFRSFVIVGDLDKVRQSMEQLHVEFSP
jgi:hypothetical protein